MWLLATGNLHKMAEIQDALRDFDVEIRRPVDLGIDLDPEEWGETFAANALIKALAFAAESGRVCLADDSGLEVDALQGAPGVYSARYAGLPTDDAANNRRLIAELAHVPANERGARFRCVLALVFPVSAGFDGPERSIESFGPQDAGRVGEHWVQTFDGVCPGHVSFEPRGTQGFGYDPYFVLEDGRHMAELDRAAKELVSHRGAALRQMAAWLRSLPAIPGLPG